MAKQQQLLGLLGDGQLHSGNELADALGVTRAAVWKHIRQLENLGVVVEAQAGKGYQLSRPIELLAAPDIRQALPESVRNRIASLEVLWSIPSTSDHLAAVAAPSSGNVMVCLAEHQTSGRGRRGRQWFAPIGNGICLSVAWHFASAPANLSCLGLAVGVGILRAVRASGVASAMLKWPNDIVLHGNKLAGVLIDVQGEAGGPLKVVAGVGVNYMLDSSTAELVDAAGGQTPAAMVESGQVVAGGRNKVAARLITEITGVLSEFERQGFSQNLQAAWTEADYLRDKSILVRTDDGDYTGVASGIMEDGQLQVDVDGELRQLVTGDVTVRAN